MANRWPYNTARWQRLRTLQLTTEPLCRYCSQAGLVTRATAVDHITPVVQAPERAFDQSNLQALCASCHNRTKQAEERSGSALGCGVDGVPRRGWE